MMELELSFGVALNKGVTVVMLSLWNQILQLNGHIEAPNSTLY